MEIFKLFATLAVNNKEANEELKETGNISEKTAAKFKTLGGKFTKVGQGITNAGKKLMPVTVGITGIGVASAKAAASFEENMAQVAATMGMTSEEINNGSEDYERLAQAARDMGKATKFSADEAAQALNYLALAGYDVDKSIETLPTVLNLAAAGGIDLAYASDMVTDSMSALGDTAGTVDNFADKMAKASQKSNTSVQQLGEAILTVGGTAKNLAGGTTELNAALGILADNGVKGAEGGTALRNIILSLSAPTDKAAEAIKNLGFDVYDAEGNMRPLNEIFKDLDASMANMTQGEKTNVLNTIFNKVDLKSANALLANCGDRFDELSGYLNDCDGAAADMADTMNNNLNGQITILKSALSEAAISIGQQLLPMIKNVVAKIQEWTDKFNSLDDNQKQTIIKIAAIVAAIAPLLLVIGKVITVIGTIVSIIPVLASPITWIILGIVALIAAIVLLVKNWDKVKEVAAKVWAKIKEIWGKVSDWFKTTIIDPIVNFFKGLWDKVVEIWEGIKNVISFAFQLIANIISAAFQIITLPFRFIWENCKEYVFAAFNAIRTFITNAINKIKSIITTVLNAIRSVWNTVWGAIKSFLTPIIDAIKSVITTAFNAIKSVITTIVNAIKSVITTIFNAIKNTVTNIINGVKNTVTNVFNAIKNAIATPLNAAKSTVSNIFDGIKSKIESVINKAKNIVQNGLNAIKGFFDKLKLKFPNIKLPHFKINGEFSLNPPKVPSFAIDWYAKAMDDGMILNKPTIFGVNSNGVPMGAGDAGSETVVGTQSLMTMVQNAVDNANNKANETLEEILAVIITMNNSLYDKIVAALQTMGVEFDERELARLVRKYA